MQRQNNPNLMILELAAIRATKDVDVIT